MKLSLAFSEPEKMIKALELGLAFEALGLFWQPSENAKEATPISIGAGLASRALINKRLLIYDM